MRISSISSISTSNRNLSRLYRSLSSGKRINSAKDDAAGLAIANKLKAEAKGNTVGTGNAKSSQEMTKVAEGGLSNVTDQLQRIRELSIQASNGLQSTSDRSVIQAEINQIKQSIGGTVSQTQFNTMHLLDGSMGSSHVAGTASGDGMDIDMSGSLLDKLGIADYDVTSGDFDISVIDDAIQSVSSMRSGLGATSNALDHMMAYTSYSAYNLTASQSRIEDQEYAQGISEMKKEQTLNTYRMMMQRKLIDNEDGQVRMLFGN